MRNTGIYWKDIARLNNLKAPDYPITQGQTLILKGYSGDGAVTSTVNPIYSASRLFAGPHQYPPKDFAAYGILAFTSRAGSSPEERNRFMMFCDAYMTELVHSSELRSTGLSQPDIPPQQQMVTIWPISTNELADNLNNKKNHYDFSTNKLEEICTIAVNNYGLREAEQAIRDARLSGIPLQERGPYLLAWSPGTQKGQKDIIMLAKDLSGVIAKDHAKNILLAWKNDIENNPDLWATGFSIEKLRRMIKDYVDSQGPKMMKSLNILTGK